MARSRSRSRERLDDDDDPPRTLPKGLRVQTDDEFQEFLPTLEEVLVSGSPRRRRALAAYLSQRADALDVYAFTSGGFCGEPLPSEVRDNDRKFWRDLEAKGEMSKVLMYWKWSIVYRQWSKILMRNPVVSLYHLACDAEQW